VKRDFHLHIVGDGDAQLITELKETAERLSLTGKITWCGYKSGQDLETEYSRAQVFVLPTTYDCFGLVLLEAMCAGVPIVSSKYADGAYDTVIEGENGYIVDPFDPEEFGKSIDRAIHEYDTLRGANAEQVKKFSFASVTEAYVQAVQYVTGDCL